MSYCVFPQLFFIVAASVFYICLNNRAKAKNQQKKFANTCAILLVIFASVLLYLALASRDNETTRSVNLSPFYSYIDVLTKYNTFDVMRLIFENILVFVPLGILLPEALLLRGKRFLVPITIASGAFLSFVIELAQFTYAIGYTEFDDLFNNTLGCAIGCSVFVFADKITVNSDGVVIKKGAFRSLLLPIITLSCAVAIVLYRELILYNK